VRIGELVKRALIVEIREVFEGFNVVYEKDNEILLKYEDAYEIVETWIIVDDEGEIETVDITVVDLDEEIATPEGCHDCLFEECPRWDNEKEECNITDEEIHEEERKWVRVVGITRGLRISRIIYKRWCYLNIPHNHIYRGYSIKLYKPTDIEKIRAVYEILEDLIDLGEILGRLIDKTEG